MWVILFLFAGVSFVQGQNPVILLPPETLVANHFPCENENATVNSFTSVSANWFEYVPPRFKSAYKGKGFINGNVSLSKGKNQYFLNVEFWIDSRESIEIYGNIPPGSSLRLQGLNKQVITLKSIEEIIPDVSQSSTMTLYKGRYEIKKPDWKWINSSGIDRIRSTGTMVLRKFLYTGFTY